MLHDASQHGPSPPALAEDKLGQEDESIGQIFDSLHHARALLARHHTGPAEYIAFPYQAFQSLVCRHWKLLRCPAGVAAEQTRPGKDTWVLRAMELRHCGRCQPSSRDDDRAQAVSEKFLDLADQPEASLVVRQSPASGTSQSDMEISPPTSPSSSSEPLSARFPPLTAKSLKKASLSRPSLKIVGPAPQDSSSIETGTSFTAQPPEMDQIYPSFEAYYAAVLAFGKAEHPEYSLYFRARKQIRPEAYCRHMNSPHASVTPSLGCKYGFSAKKQPGGETYKVTKSHPYHLPECRRRTLAEVAATSGSASQRKRKMSAFDGSDAADSSENEENVVEGGKKRKLSSST